MAFVSILPLSSSSFSSSPSVSPIRPPASSTHFLTSPARLHSTTKAILDTPANNTYLQRKAEVVLRDFLTRRSVDTILYYMHELGDGPTHNWLSSFDNFSTRVKERKFTDGDRFIEKLMQTPCQDCVLVIGHPSGRFSRKINFTIEPIRIARRITDIRVQLATEWAHDLLCVEKENLELQRISFEQLLTTTQAELDAKRNLIFDSDPFAHDQTPLRFKNYVGLKTLITQHAVMRLLPFLRDCGSNHDYMYLHQFVNTYGPIGDGDEFVRILMSRPAEFRTNPTTTVLPKSIALQVLDMREVIAKEWITALEFVPVEAELQARGHLEKSMEASHDLPVDGTESDGGKL